VEVRPSAAQVERREAASGSHVAPPRSKVPLTGGGYSLALICGRRCTAIPEMSL